MLNALKYQIILFSNATQNSLYNYFIVYAFILFTFTFAKSGAETVERYLHNNCKRRKPQKTAQGAIRISSKDNKGCIAKKKKKQKRNERESAAAANVLQNNKQNNKSKYEIIMPGLRPRQSRPLVAGAAAAASEKGKQDSPRNAPGSRCAPNRCATRSRSKRRPL